MKTILCTILLFTIVHSSCHLRSIQSCLSDEKFKEECQSRPSNCQDIDATNPNNCSGIQCYYDYKLKACQPYEDEFQINSRRILDNQDYRNDHESESQNQDENQQSEIQQEDQNENKNDEQSSNPQNNTQQQPTSPEPEYNTTINTNNPETNDTLGNFTSQNTTNSNTLTFEVVQFSLDSEKILNSNLEDKDLIINTSFQRLLATFLLAKLMI